MRCPPRLFALSCAALLLGALLTPAADARRFSMSYLYFGNPSAYVQRVQQTQGSLNEISPNYFNLNADGSLNFTGSSISSFVSQMQIGYLDECMPGEIIDLLEAGANAMPRLARRLPVTREIVTGNTTDQGNQQETES